MTPKKSAAAKKLRKKIVDKKIAVAATPAEVWKALTTAEGLRQWFPLEAAVKPGEGGAVTVSWGEQFSFTTKIEEWKPEKRLRLAGSGPGDTPIVQQWTIEKRGGKTIVRLVQSSFDGGTEWEKEFYDSTNYGWGFMLTNLRHYLERHEGEERQVAWAKRKLEGTRTQAYRKLMGSGGVFTNRRLPGVGKRYRLRATTGEEWAGRVEFVKRPRGFCVTVEGLRDALAWLTIEGLEKEPEAQMWISTYGLGAEKVKELEENWRAAFERIFEPHVQIQGEKR